MKYLTLITLLIISIAVYSQEKIKTDTLNQFVNNLEQGYWIHKNSDNIILSEGYYIEGAKIGTWKEYSLDIPKTVYKGVYDNGLREGDWYLISTVDGTKIAVQKHNKGIRVGYATFFW